MIDKIVDGHRIVVDGKTSIRMGGVRQADTVAERTVRRVLHQIGARYRTGVRDLPGSPDIANRKRRWAVFVHGCFWHRHAGCPRTTTPKRNTSFWVAKFDANRSRDRRALRALRKMGYAVCIVWECEVQEPVKLARRLLRQLPLGIDARRSAFSR